MHGLLRLTALRLFLSLLMLTLISRVATAGEERLPLWEFGIGGGAYSLPQYMGSDERYTFPFAFPYLVYRGEHWRLDRSGLRNRLFDIDRLSLDLSLAGGLPVNNSNKARQGMPELFLTGEVGPQVNWMISESDRISWSAHLAWRAAINIRGTYIGWVTEPFLRYNYRTSVAQGKLRFRFDLGTLFGSQQYHETYYSVDPVYATATRPAYQARGGLHSLYAKANIRYPLSRDIELFTTLQGRTLSVGTIRNSPLVRSSTYTSISLGATWIFAVSDETVLQDEAARGG